MKISNIKLNRQSTPQGVYVSVEEMLQLRHIGSDLTLDTRKKSVAIMDGDAKTHFRGRGMDFAEVRPYQAGDDIRNIDWRVTARTQKPYTKLYQEERERPVFILVDQRASMFFGSHTQFKSVLAAKLAAVIGWAALANNDRIGALVFSDTEQTDSRARRGKHALLSFLHILNTYNNQLSSPIAEVTPETHLVTMEEMLKDVRRVAKPGSSIFVLSDFHDYTEECKKPLSLLARHTDITLLQIYDDLEKQLPHGKNLVVSNGHAKTNLATASNRFSENYQHSFNEISQKLRSDAGKIGAQFGSIEVGTPITSCALDIFTSHTRKNRQRKDQGNNATQQVNV